MRRWRVLIVLLQTVLVAGLALALRDPRVPLGVRGEWEWMRLKVAPNAVDVVLVLLAIAAYAGLGALGWRAMGRTARRARECAWMVVLFLAAVAIQTILPSGAPYGYGLSKWSIGLHNSGSSGYYTVARDQIPDGWRFWHEYPEWARSQSIPRFG
ncbi:MAG TPA: hypothetical protein VGZ22_01095, partial [Isosphaeraceae bacterium]|nr:hypothetical protein [Isosphaeraceae bacterium]